MFAGIGSGDQELMLFSLQNEVWISDEEDLVDLDTEENRMVVTVDELYEFALFGKDRVTIFIPFVIK
jgi:hypothetical protein